MPAPSLTPDQIAQVSGLVGQYITAQRERYNPHAVPLSAQQRAAMNGFFSKQLLDNTRLVVLQGERVAKPDFYPMLRNLAFNNLPDKSIMGAITFSDVVVSHEAFSDGLLFHEYEAVRKPVTLVPEQRIVDVRNQYVKEIGSPDEAIVSVAEIHNMRDGSFTVAQLMWARGNQTIWTMPNVFALGPDGKVADGCRAVEALRVIHDLDDLFQNLRGARDRLQKGIVPSEEIKKHVGEPKRQSHSTVRFEAYADTNSIHAAERRYMQEHGSVAYAQLLVRLFDELFPAD